LNSLSACASWERVFQCARCGICCYGIGGIVLSSSEVSRLAVFLEAHPQISSHSWLERRNNKNSVRSGTDGNCLFFSASHGCLVHPVKPAICRAWPFFRGNLVDPYSLALAKEYCRGIEPDVSHAEFVRAGLDYVEFLGIAAPCRPGEPTALRMPGHEEARQ